MNVNGSFNGVNVLIMKKDSGISQGGASCAWRLLRPCCLGMQAPRQGQHMYLPLIVSSIVPSGVLVPRA